MVSILIVESNPPDLLGRGNSGAACFTRTFLSIDPTVRLSVTAPYASAFCEGLLEGVDAVVFTGSSAGWSTDAPEAAPLRRAMEKVLAAGLPIWGSCNGLQLVSVVLGGAVGASPNGLEIGIAQRLKLTADGASHKMFAGRTAEFAVPCIHRDEVTRLPEGATLLVGNEHSWVQAVAIETGGVDFWGTQYHPEMSARDIAWSAREKGIFENGADNLDDLDQAEFDDKAAQRLGTSTRAQALSTRSRELANWLDHVASRSKGRTQQAA